VPSAWAKATVGDGAKEDMRDGLDGVCEEGYTSG